MKKLILMALAGFLWKKMRPRGQSDRSPTRGF